MPVLRLVNSFVGAGASNHPRHLAILGLGPQHGWTPQKGSEWLHSPTRSGGQIHQVDRSEAHHQHSLGKRRSSSSLTSSIVLMFLTVSSLTTELTSPKRSSWTSMLDMASGSTGPRSDIHVLMVRSSGPMAWSSKDSSHASSTDLISTSGDGLQRSQRFSRA